MRAIPVRSFFIRIVIAPTILAASFLAVMATAGLAQNTSSPVAPSASSQNTQDATAPSTNVAGAITNTQIEVPATVQWVDTKLDLRGGEKIHITATGTVTYAQGQKSQGQPLSFGPDGLKRGWKDLVHQYAVPDAGHGALIARLGTGDAAQPFLVGADKDYEAPVGGHLFLGINQSQSDAANASGSFQATVEILAVGTGLSAGGPAESTIAAITPDLLKEIPRRVSDMQGNPGDMVNVLIVGSENQLVKAFTSAGWVKVDSSVQNTVLSGFVNSIEKKDYLTMPMSTLYLFKRPQDYGFAHAEPVRVAMSRNHLRVWKSPYTVDGQQLWCVAATHDIGFERDQRNNGLTHKIDPAIDGEREYVNETLSGTGLVMQRSHVTPADALTEAKTATGGTFHSDGRILVLILTKDQN